jgi:general secretion pathway protein D
MFWKAHSGRFCIGLPHGRALAVCAATVLWAALLSVPTLAQAPESAAAQIPETPATQGADTPQAAVAPSNQGNVQSSGMAVGPAALPGPSVTKRQRREAESAYMDGAKKLDHDELEAAQHAFEHAAMLDPGNGSYAAAASIARQHRVVELVRKVSQARAGGDENKAQSLLEQARAIDPGDPLVLEHAEPPMSLSSAQTRMGTPQLASTTIASASQSNAQPGGAEETALPWSIVPNAAGPIHLTPTPGTQTFNLGGDSYDVIRRLFQAYGIKTALDGSIEHKNLRFNMEEVNYTQAVTALTTMTNTLLVPVDQTTVLVAKNDSANRTRLERQLEETVYLPGLATAEFNETVQLLKGIFDRAVLTPQPTHGAIVVRAPESVIGALNQTVQGLQEARGELVVEVQLYEVDTTKMLNAGANIPNAFGVYNVDQAAAQLVSQNASLVQQAIAQGLISPTASNFEIAAALIGSGLVKSSLLNSTIGVFGGGLTQTGITETGSLGINLGLNSSDTRTLDDVQLRVRDREQATFREGTRYPVTNSTYTTGLSGAASALGNLNNATVNGVSVGKLLSQFTGGAATTIPQVSYEDLGITLDATPTVEKSGRISIKLKLKIEALTGNSVNNIPVLASREFDSNLSVGEGQSALLSSLVSSNEVSAMSGLPGLSELPGFQLPITNNVQRQSTQLVVVVTPHVVRRRSDIAAGPRIPVPPEVAGQ